MQEKKTEKQEVKKHKNAEPEKTEDLSQRISEAAYALYEKSGFRHGNDEKDWLEAEQLVLKNR